MNPADYFPDLADLTDDEAAVVERALEGGAFDEAFAELPEGAVLLLCERLAVVATGILGRPVSKLWVLAKLVTDRSWRNRIGGGL